MSLEYWTVYEKDSALNKVMEAAAAKLQASANITVTIVNKGDSGFRELLTASAMSQSGPDLTFNWTGLSDIVTSGRQGLHYPLNKDNLFTKDELSNLLLLDSCTDPNTGDVYGTAYGNNYIAVAYNKQMMTQAGIDWTKFPPKWTYDQFLAVCKQLKDAGIAPFGYANKEGIFADWWFSFTFPTYVDKITDVIPYYNKKPLYNDVFADVMTKWKAFRDAGYYLDGGNTISINDLWGQFTAKKCAIIPLFPALYSIYVKALGEENVGIMEWPSMGGQREARNAGPDLRGRHRDHQLDEAPQGSGRVHQGAGVRQGHRGPVRRPGALPGGQADEADGLQHPRRRAEALRVGSPDHRDVSRGARVLEPAVQLRRGEVQQLLAGGADHGAAVRLRARSHSAAVAAAAMKTAPSLK